MTRIAYVAPEALALSHTFIFREILALDGLGEDVAVYSLRKTPDANKAAEAAPLEPRVSYIYPVGLKKVLQKSLAAFRRKPQSFLSNLCKAIKDAAVVLPSNPVHAAKLLWQFGVGAVVADDLRARGVQHVHAHFANAPAGIAMYAAAIAGIPFSFTAHANDIFVNSSALRQKVARAAFAVTISEHGREFLRSLKCDLGKLHLVHCGVNPRQFDHERLARRQKHLQLLGIGRLVEKKGFRYLIEAVALLHEQGVPVHCAIAGEGPERAALEMLIARRGLHEHVRLVGAVQPNQVPALMLQSDVFILPCVRSKNGDQDGIPVALMEAMAAGVPVVSTRISGIPELVRNGETGLLVGPGDPAALADAVRMLYEREELREKLSVQGRRHIEEEFSIEKSARMLAELFRHGQLQIEETRNGEPTGAR